MTDAAFMFAVLKERPGQWVAQVEIINRSASERGYGLTPHSRAPELRAEGHQVENKIEVRHGRRVSFYRLVVGEPGAQPDHGRSDAPGITPSEPSPTTEQLAFQVPWKPAWA